MFAKIFGKRPAHPEQDDPLVPMPIPALVAILLHKEKEKGAALTEAEVIEIRDKCACIMLPLSQKREMDEKRGYADIDPEQAWEQWQQVRGQLNAGP